jgi:hypothetical protein
MLTVKYGKHLSRLCIWAREPYQADMKLLEEYLHGVVRVRIRHTSKGRGRRKSCAAVAL